VIADLFADRVSWY